MNCVRHAGGKDLTCGSVLNGRGLSNDGDDGEEQQWPDDFEE